MKVLKLLIDNWFPVGWLFLLFMIGIAAVIEAFK